MTARADLATSLKLEPAAPTKTFVLEVHTDDPATYLDDLFGPGAVSGTSDAFLHRAQLDGGEMWVDQLDSRFWSFHTDMPVQPAKRFLHHRVQRSRDLDWLWLPSDHLLRVSKNAPARRLRTDFAGGALRGSDAAGAGLKLQATGRRAEKLLEYLAGSPEYRGTLSLDAIHVAVDDGLGGVMNEAVDQRGVFAASGDSLETHFQFVRSVVGRYAYLVELLEAKAIGWNSLENGGGTLDGGPIGIQFSEPVTDLVRFVDMLFTSKEPFRLWGVPRITDEGVAEVDAVDLHVGQRLRIDIGPGWMRVYLERDSCGNTVARLITNLQHSFDSRLSLSDPDLQQALTAGSDTLDGPPTTLASSTMRL